jgi:protein-arginine kinase activator protein McsA
MNRPTCALCPSQNDVIERTVVVDRQKITVNVCKNCADAIVNTGIEALLRRVGSNVKSLKRLANKENKR